MMNEWEYQLRISFEKNYADDIRGSKSNVFTDDLFELLGKFDAKLICQFDAFNGYVLEAENNGIENYPLYKWTKSTIENKSKKEKYLKSFTVYIKDQQIYSKEIADNLEEELLGFKGENSNIFEIFKYDTNPENNPQVPDEYK